ncbi:MAG: NTP transferase domain-containing protein [Bacteroidetes bacterium]|nr:NTP transferase domain-containing protein [Bacteroidota bacterium]
MNDVSQVVESDGYSYLIDDKKNIGPVAGLIRACKANPKTDVIIVGCDYPHLNDEMLKKLIQSNDESFLASVFLIWLKIVTNRCWVCTKVNVYRF